MDEAPRLLVDWDQDTLLHILYLSPHGGRSVSSPVLFGSSLNHVGDCGYMRRLLRLSSTPGLPWGRRAAPRSFFTRITLCSTRDNRRLSGGSGNTLGEGEETMFACPHFFFLTPLYRLLSYGLAPRPCVDADNGDDASVAALWSAVLFDHVIDYRPFPLHINPAARPYTNP